MGRRELETEGREYAKAGEEFRFAPFLPTPPPKPQNYGRWYSGQEEECCEAGKAEDLNWTISGRS